MRTVPERGKKQKEIAIGGSGVRPRGLLVLLSAGESRTVRPGPLSQAPEEISPARAKKLYMKMRSDVWREKCEYCNLGDQEAPERRSASGGLGALRRTKMATEPVLMTQAYFRAPPIGRMGSPRAVCEAAGSAAADAPCHGGGGTPKPAFARASDASLWRLRLPALAGCSSFP
eukprot:COSAG02_NODE_796_length_17128_cov_176.587586_7_plen_173_part_00